MDAVRRPAKGRIADRDIVDDPAIGRQQERRAVGGEAVRLGREPGKAGMGDVAGDRDGDEVGQVGGNIHASLRMFRLVAMFAPGSTVKPSVSAGPVIRVRMPGPCPVMIESPWMHRQIATIPGRNERP